MAVTYSLIKEGRSGAIDSAWNRTYKKTYRARTDHHRVGAKAVLAACPEGIGNTYAAGSVGPPDTTETDLGSFVVGIGYAVASEDGLDWEVVVDYGPAPGGGFLDENPLDRPADVSWGSNVVEEVVDQDRDGNAVVNTAYDYFDPALTRPERVRVLTVERNEATYDFALAASLEDCTNLADFLEAGDLGLWVVAGISGNGPLYAVLSDDTVVTYWRVRYELQRDYDGWERPVLNQGMRQLNALGAGWIPITMQGQPISSPALLDASGYALAEAGTPVFLTFRTFRTASFALLNFAGIDLGMGPLP